MFLPRKYVRQLLVFIALATALYGVFAVLGGAGDVTASFVVLGAAGWASILGLSLLNYAIRFTRWQAYLGWIGYRVPAGPNLLYYLAGFALTATPGKAGEAIRSIYLKHHNVAYADSLAAFFVERFVDLIAMVLLALLAVFSFDTARWPVIVVGVLALALLPLIHSQGLQDFLDRKRQSLTSERLRAAGQHLLELLRSSSRLLRAGPLYAGLGLGVLAWSAEGYAFYLILGYLDVQISLFLAVGIYAVSMLAGAISFIPGGLGSTEAVMGILLVLAGADPSAAVAATLICRIATLWFAVIIGMAVMMGIESRSGLLRQDQLP